MDVAPPPEQPDDAGLRHWLLSSVDRELLVREAVERAVAARRPPPEPKPGWLKSAPAYLSGFFQHTAVLLFLGFLLTGVVGSALASAWQHNSWVNQQTLLAKQRSLDQKYELANTVAKVIGDTHAAPGNVLRFYANEDTPSNRGEFDQRVKHLRQTYTDWLTQHNVLLQRVSIHVRDPQAREHFQNIYNLRKRTHNHILNLIANKAQFRKPLPEDLPPTCETLEAERRRTRDRIKQLKACGPSRAAAAEIKKLEDRQRPLLIKLDQTCALSLLNDADDQAGELMKIMAREIMEDSTPQEPQSFWSVLRSVFGFGTSAPATNTSAPSPTPTPAPPPAPAPTHTPPCPL